MFNSESLNSQPTKRQTEFRCPVCRARQELSEECRRCKADLTLVYKAHQRLDYLNSQPETARTQAERKLLAPGRDE